MLSFHIKSLFVLEKFTILQKQLVKKAKINFKICDVADWTTNNYNTHTVQYFKKLKQIGNGIWLVNKT